MRFLRRVNMYDSHLFTHEPSEIRFGIQSKNQIDELAQTSTPPVIN